MKHSTPVLIGHAVISVCILLFSIIGIAIVALMTKVTFIALAWFLNGAFELSWHDFLRSIKIGVIGVGINLFRFVKIKGF